MVNKNPERFSEEIYGYSLKNAIEFGKADAGKVLPKLFQHGLDKKEIKSVFPQIQGIVKEVNKFSEEERNEKFKYYEKYIKEHEEKEKVLPELPNHDGKLVFRIAPFPSGALHLGNVKTFILNALYAKKYKGKLILVMDDTIGSEKKPIELDAYDLITSGLKWLGVKYDGKIIYKSSRLKIYYEYAEKLIERDKAYVCHCTVEELRQNRIEGRECACRAFPVDVQLLRWNAMFKEKEGHATLRIKTDMKHKNPAFRDRVLFKISDREHPKVGNKYRVWPTLEMSWAIDDHLLGITHIIRGNDLMIESDMERYIWDIFSWRNPEIIHTGFVKVEGVGAEGAKVSKSKAREEVISGNYSGWDDPRTWSIQSLERRGIEPKAIWEFVEDIGLNKQDITVPIETLYSLNRKVIDEKSDRYFFIEKPVEIKISNMPDWKSVEVPLHPDKDETRKVMLDKIFVSSEDFKKLKGKEIRLVHLFNLKFDRETEITSMENKKIPKIQWVSHNVKTEILMPSGEVVEGVADSGISKLKKGDIIQFERFGFVRFDGKSGDVYKFRFAHK